jgi:hypothetical protein
MDDEHLAVADDHAYHRSDLRHAGGDTTTGRTPGSGLSRRQAPA